MCSPGYLMRDELRSSTENDSLGRALCAGLGLRVKTNVVMRAINGSRNARDYLRAHVRVFVAHTQPRFPACTQPRFPASHSRDSLRVRAVLSRTYACDSLRRVRSFVAPARMRFHAPHRRDSLRMQVAIPRACAMRDSLRACVARFPARNARTLLPTVDPTKSLTESPTVSPTVSLSVRVA